MQRWTRRTSRDAGEGTARAVRDVVNKEYREESEDFMRALQERFGEGDPWLQPEEMAGTAVFLASSDADPVTGANVLIDRGYSAY